MPKFCQECGTTLGEGDRFCPSCGKPIVATNATKIQEPAAPKPEPPRPAQRQQPIHKSTYVEEEEMHSVDWKQFKPKITIGKPQVSFISKRQLIIIGIVVAIVLLLALFTK